MPFTAIDISVDAEGDLVVGASGDLELASELETLEADILFRLKTEHFDYGPVPFIGADLRTFQGEPNNQRTLDMIKEHVYIALTQDGRVAPGVLTVEAVPLSINTVHVFVIVSDRIGNETEPSVVSYTLELLPTEIDNESILNQEE